MSILQYSSTSSDTRIGDGIDSLIEPMMLETELRRQSSFNNRSILSRIIVSFCRLGAGSLVSGILLLALGIILGSIGWYWYSINRKGYVLFMVFGAVATLPGGYGVYEAIGMLRGWHGFEKINDTENFDDEYEWNANL